MDTRPMESLGKTWQEERQGQTNTKTNRNMKVRKRQNYEQRKGLGEEQGHDKK
jgi:hypothetical protein